MRVEEIVVGKEYRLLTDIGGVGYSPGDGVEFRELKAGSIVTVNKVVFDLHILFGQWNHTVIVSQGSDGYNEEEDAYEISYTGLVGANFLEEV
nr:MAG TPA: hypothetical protein [Caudoviricetes sp.]